MKKTITIKQNKETLLRITVSGKEELVLKALAEISSSIFVFSNIGSKIRDILERKEEI